MMSSFKNPEMHLAQADALEVAAIVAATADLALVVGGDDVIRDVSHNLDSVSGASIPSWRGQQVERVVRSTSRSTLRKAIDVARTGARGERFDIRHLIDGGNDLPVQYCAHRIGGDGTIMLMGRDLRLVSELQSRLLANRQSLEQNARGKKQAEAHYRLLFETAADAIVIVEAATGKVREANPRAVSMLRASGVGLSGKRFVALFDKARQGDVQSLLSGVAISGGPATLRAQLGGINELTLSAELFRAGDLKLILVRMTMPADGRNATVAAETGVEVLVRNAAEAVVLTDEDGALLWVNESFLALVDIALAPQALGRRLDDFFRWSGVGQDMLLDNIRRHGRVPAFSATVVGANGQSAIVDVSAVAIPDATPPGYGFVIRARGSDGDSHATANSDLTRTAENLVEMIGRAPMKDLVRDTTDVIERMCIEAALRLTGNNRASAARVLGLSRQALYLKMNRFGIADGE